MSAAVSTVLCKCGRAASECPTHRHAYVGGVALDGAKFLANDNADPKLAAGLRDLLLAKAAEAREDLCAFFEFVMRAENTQLPMKIAEHEKLGYEFLLAHDRCVWVWSVEHSKTTCLAAYCLWRLGRDPAARIAYVSYMQAQAMKVVTLVRQYIESSSELHLVFPKLRPSQNPGDLWTQDAITIDRPRGIKDASLFAVGMDGARITGSRLTDVVVDDIINRENAATPDQRQKVEDWIGSSVTNRLVWTPDGRMVVANSPWHPDDFVARLEKNGWPVLKMGIDGDIVIQDDLGRMRLAVSLAEETGADVAEHWKPFNSPLIRPRSDDPSDEVCRLAAHDPDPDNAVPLWPEAFPLKRIEELQIKHSPYEYNRAYRCITRDDATAMCKREYIDTALAKARALGVRSMVASYRGPNPVFCGVDLAVRAGQKNDSSAFFTFMCIEDGTRVILDVEVTQINGPQILDKLAEKAENYGAHLCVENVAAQDYILQFAVEKNKLLSITPYTTHQQAKAHPHYGVAGVFNELRNGAWAIPNDGGPVHPQLKLFIDACLYYSPDTHTDDVLMANFFGRELARKWGALLPRNPGNNAPLGANLLAR